MYISDKEFRQLKKYVADIDASLQRRTTTTKVRTLTRHMRLLFTRMERRDKEQKLL